MEDKQIVWLRENILNYSWKELQKEFNHLFGTTRSLSGIRWLCQENGISKKGIVVHKNIWSKYTKEQIEWLKENWQTWDLSPLFYKEFGVKVSNDALRYQTRKLGFIAVNRFSNYEKEFIRKNFNNYINFADFLNIYNKEFNTNVSEKYLRDRIYKIKILKEKKNGHGYPIGSEMLDDKGFVLIKYDDKWYEGNGNRNNWTLKHRYLYEKYHDIKLEQDDVVLFIDGNKHNFSKDNLVKVKRNTFMNLIKNHWDGKGELTLAGIELLQTLEILNKTERK